MQVSQLQAWPWRPAEPPGLSWPGSQGRSISQPDGPTPCARLPPPPALVLTCGDWGSGQGARVNCLAVQPLCLRLLSSGPCPPSLSSWRCMVISATTTSDPGWRISPQERCSDQGSEVRELEASRMWLWPLGQPWGCLCAGLSAAALLCPPRLQGRAPCGSWLTSPSLSTHHDPCLGAGPSREPG